MESGKTCKDIDNRCLFYCIYHGWMPPEMASYSKNFLYNNNMCASLFCIKFVCGLIDYQMNEKRLIQLEHVCSVILA